MINIISRTRSITHADMDDDLDVADVFRELERGARLSSRGEHLSVSFVLEFEEVNGGSPTGKRGRRGTVTLFGHGYDPRRVLEAAEESGSISRALAGFANEKPGVSGARRLQRVEMQLFPTQQRGVQK